MNATDGCFIQLISQISQQKNKSFLSIKNNKHWDGIQRQTGLLTRGMDRLREALSPGPTHGLLPPWPSFPPHRLLDWLVAETDDLNQKRCYTARNSIV